MTYKDKDQQREYQRVWLAKRRSDFFADKFCAKCGSVTRLELDHKDPSQKVDHRIWSWSLARRDVEVAKCQILCYKCHQSKTSTEATKGETHYNHKLTDEDVFQIRKLHKSGQVPNEIARTYGVAGPTIRDIVYGRTWTHI